MGDVTCRPVKQATEEKSNKEVQELLVLVFSDLEPQVPLLLLFAPRLEDEQPLQ